MRHAVTAPFDAVLIHCRGGRLVAVHVQRERGGSAVVGANLDHRAQRVAFAVVWRLAWHAWAPRFWIVVAQDRAVLQRISSRRVFQLVDCAALAVVGGVSVGEHLLGEVGGAQNVVREAGRP